MSNKTDIYTIYAIGICIFALILYISYKVSSSKDDEKEDSSIEEIIK